jgi:hypothetical protein
MLNSMRSVFALFAFALAACADSASVDRFIFEKAGRDRIPIAPVSSDSEFLRRVYLDLTGRLPEPEAAAAFLADKDTAKREKVIDSLFPEKPIPGMRSIKEHPFLDRWGYFFNDLFRNGQLLEEGINTFYDWIYKCLLLNIPYDQMVREMITASAVSTWTNGPANFLARNRVFEGDGYMMNHEDTADELALTTTKLFLGVNLECISCHDGAAHLEKISLWHSQKKRAEVWRQASFFGKTYISPEFGRSPQFIVNDTREGYDTSTISALRPKRYKADLTPTFILTGEQAHPGESPRAAYARLLTSQRQFARATVNLFWWELMGRGIVENPFDFDLARQDPANPPPAPWTVQPSHPELLEALAAGFEKSGYDLRWLIRTIVSSRAYQLSAAYDGEWKEEYYSYFTRRQVRRLSAEQFYDAVSQVTRNPTEFKITYSAKKTPFVFQTHSPMDIDKSDRKTYLLLQAFGQCDRYDAEASRRASMVQAATLLNSQTIREKIVLKEEHPWLKVAAEERVDQVFLTALSRMPTPGERKTALALLDRATGPEATEDLLWAMINRLDFLFY